MKNNFNGLVKSLVYGFAVGDSLGVPVEFVSRRELKKNPVIDMREYGTHMQPKGTWSDDTSMTLATMSVLTRYGINYELLAEEFVSWLQKGKWTTDGHVFDVGTTCRKAITNYSYGTKKAIECGLNDEKSSGNGSLMRMYPIAMYSYANRLSDEEIKEVVYKSSAITHASELARFGCLFLVLYIVRIFNGESKRTTYKSLCEALERVNYPEEYKRLVEGKIDSLKIRKIKSTGFVVDTLEAVMWTFLNFDKYQDTVLTAVNLGDDTDTIGAIVGGLAGYYYGFDNIPKQWIEELRGKDIIDKTCNDFITIKKAEN